jgi:hypothetical protein
MTLLAFMYSAFMYSAFLYSAELRDGAVNYLLRCTRTGKPGFTMDNRNPARSQQMFHTAHELIDGGLLVGHQSCKIRRGLRARNSKVTCSPAASQQLCRCCQRFRGNAANVEARATHALLLHENDACPALSRR